MKKIKISITGSEGFLGKHLIKLLKDEKKMITLPFIRSAYDLLDSTSLKNFVKDADVVIHLAGVNRDNDYNTLKVNLLGTQSLLEAIKKYGNRPRIIFSSSAQVYKTNNVYSLSKKFAEEFITYYSYQENTNSYILRIANVYGPGGKPFYNSVIATFISQIKNNEAITINGNGKQKRDYIYVSDVANCIKKIITSPQEKIINKYDVGTGKMFSLNFILKLLGKISNREIKIVYNKNATLESPSNLDVNKTKKDFNWECLVDLSEGLKLTYENK